MSVKIVIDNYGTVYEDTVLVNGIGMCAGSPDAEGM